jgi:hypothetical protein
MSQYEVTREGGHLLARHGLAGRSSVLFTDLDGERNINIVAGTRNCFSDAA